MNKQMNYRNQSGLSILEVVIGIFIFVVGMMALASLQGALTRSMADAKVRTTAANIADRTIEQQRGFSRLTTDPAGVVFAYNDIVTSNTTETVGGVAYNIALVVTDHYYQVASDTFTTTTTGATASSYKQVEVTVSWDAAQNFRANEGADISAAAMGSGNIKLTSVVPALVTSASASVANESDRDIAAPPVAYTPGLNPDIVSLALGDFKFKESLLPEPDVTRSEELVETRFDVITYSQTGLSAQFLRREEFAVVSCECTLKSASADVLGRRPVVWAGDEYVRGQLVQKAYGESANKFQSSLCDTCCRDHHDGGSSAEDHSDVSVNVYNPFRASADYVSSGGNHRHYNRAANTGLPVEVTSSGSTYVEACRMVRQDGFFRVGQDFRREDLNAFPSDFLDASSEIDVYSSYVTGAVADYKTAAIASAASPNYTTTPPCIGPSPCTVSGPPLQGAYDAPISVDADGNPTQMPSWTTLPLGIETTQQLRSRGVYLDYISHDLRTVLTNCTGSKTAADDACKSGDVELDRTGSVNALEMIPFFDVQMTKLNRWNESPVPNIPVDTTNETLATDNTHSRGIISKSADGESTVEASGHRGNLGFTDTMPIDLRYDSQVTDTSLVVAAGTGTPITGTAISGTLSHTLAGNPNLNIIVTGLGGALCGQTSVGYSCIVPDGEANPRIELSGYGKKNTDRYVCSIGTILDIDDGTAAVVRGTGAKAVFKLLAKAAGTDYNFVIQSTACLTEPPVTGG